MNGYVPEVGHRVRVVIEGTVRDTSAETFGLDLDGGGGYGYRHDTVADVQRIAEPQWVNGDVVYVTETPYRSGRTLLRQPFGKWVSDISSDSWTRDDVSAAWAEGIATHVLRDGKPVQS